MIDTTGNNKTLIFFGELPPKTNHGVSISNQINLTFLKEKFDVVVVEEFSDLKFHDRFSVQKMFTFLRSCVKFNREVSHRPHIDIFYTILYQSLFGILKNAISIFLFRRKFKSSKVILHVHRSDFNSFYSSRINKLLFDYVSKNTDKFLLLARGQMSVFPVADAKKSVIYNTIEYEVDTPVYGLKTAPYKLINISNYIPQKGLAELLDALKLLPQTQFSLDAYGNISDPDFYNSIIAKAKQTSNVQIHEAINGAVKFEKLKQAQLFICPSHNEGFPLVLLEAMSVGLPIVTTKVGFIEEMLGSDYPLYCEPNNATSLAQAINQFFELENKQELSERIKHLYHAKFSRLVHKQVLNQIFDIEN